jgi:sarcosine oxidase gamma subunit
MALAGLPAKTLAERLEVAEKEVIELRIKNKILVDRLAELAKPAETPTFEAVVPNGKAKKK